MMQLGLLVDSGDGDQANENFDRQETGTGYVPQGCAQHLGIRPGEKIEWEKQPEGAIMFRAVRPRGTINSFLGLLARRTRKIANLDEMSDAAAAGWSILR